MGQEALSQGVLTVVICLGRQGGTGGDEPRPGGNVQEGMEKLLGAVHPQETVQEVIWGKDQVDAQVEVRGQEEIPEVMEKLLGAGRPPAGQEVYPAVGELARNG
jgi:hypothetical protein